MQETNVNHLVHTVSVAFEKSGVELGSEVEELVNALAGNPEAAEAFALLMERSKDQGDL